MTGMEKGGLKYSKALLDGKEHLLARFVGAALLSLDDAVGKDEAELTVHEAWLAIRESVEPELSRWEFLRY